MGYIDGKFAHEPTAATAGAGDRLARAERAHPLPQKLATPVCVLERTTRVRVATLKKKKKSSKKIKREREREREQNERCMNATEVEMEADGGERERRCEKRATKTDSRQNQRSEGTNEEDETGEEAFCGERSAGVSNERRNRERERERGAREPAPRVYRERGKWRAATEWEGLSKWPLDRHAAKRATHGSLAAST